jgi:plastocyanin
MPGRFEGPGKVSFLFGGTLYNTFVQNIGGWEKGMKLPRLAGTALAVLFFGVQAPGWTQSPNHKSGGTLVGKLTVTAPPRKVIAPSNDNDSDEYGYSAPTVSAPAPALPEEVVFYLKKVPGTYAPPKKHAQLDQNHRQFGRRVLPVLKGTVVDFTNHDTVYHNIFTNSQINKFDLGRKNPGQTVSKRMFHSEVPVKVYCDIHSEMRAYILVLDNPYFTTAAPGKTFEIDGIPPGTYTLVAWHDYWDPVERKVTIKKGKRTRADITLAKVRD